MKKALLIVDLQNDFVTGGALEVPDGEQIVPGVNTLQSSFEHIYATQDWHPPGHSSFASSHEDKKPFDVIQWKGQDQTLWPDHCVQGTRGADFHPDLKMNKVQAIFRKGMDPSIDSYSGFYDNGHQKQTGLEGFLKGLGVKKLYFCGLAADICVYFSILDALGAGFECALCLDAIKPLSSENYQQQLTELEQKGVELVRNV